MPSPSTNNTHVRVTTTADKPPTDSSIRAAMWWATRPWINTIAVLTLVGTFAGVVMLAIYLGKIDRLDLLQQAVASKVGLLLIVTWALVLAGTLLIAVFGSLWFFDTGASIYKHSSDVPASMPWVLLGGLLLWLTTIFILFAHSRSSTWFQWCVWGLLVLLVLMCCGSEALQLKGRSGCKKQWPGAIFRGLLIGGTVWFALMMSALAPFSLLVLDPSFSHAPLGWKTAIVCVAISAPAPAAGWVSFLKFAGGTTRATVRKNIMLAVLLASLLGLLLLWPSVAMQTLKGNGVYSTSVEQFVVPDKALALSLRSAGFPATASTSMTPGLIAPTTPTSAAKVNAFVRFRFGSALVLCTTPTDPMEPPTPTTNPAYRTEDNHWAPGHCLDVTANSVQRAWSDPTKHKTK